MMDYSTDDTNGKPISRDVSLTDILISKGVQELNLISAIVALGEGEPKGAISTYSTV